MSWWLRSCAVVVAVAASIATQPPPSWTVSDDALIDIELSEQAPEVIFLVTATYDVPDDDVSLSIAATAVIERAIGSGEILTVSIDPDDGGDGGDTDARDLARNLTVVSAFSDLEYCGRPCTRDFLVTVTWTGAPANDVASVELTITASAGGGDTREVPDGADVQVSAELLE